MGIMMSKVDPIEVANSKSLEDFTREYLPGFDCESSPPSTIWTSPQTTKPYNITLLQPTNLSPTEMTTCFNLIKETSYTDYAKSKSGWNSKTKRKEMLLDDLKYLLIKSNEGEIAGFASVMPTYEDGEPVLYCYEIHLEENFRGTRLGSYLISLMKEMASKIPSITKVMLTCYTRNEQALKFYQKLGFEKDEFSPEPRVLRDGRVVECEYLILSLVV